MSDTGPTPEEFKDDLTAEKSKTDARTLSDDRPADVVAQPSWLQDELMPPLPYRWYFIVYGADGWRVGQFHVRAVSRLKAIEAAEAWVNQGQRLSAPVRWPGASF